MKREQIYPRKVLYIPPTGIGDNLMLLQSAHLLKKQYPKTRIDFLSKFNGVQELLKYSDCIDNILELPIRPHTFRGYSTFFGRHFFPLVKRIRRERYDVIFSINPNLLRFSLRTFFWKKSIFLTDKNENQIKLGLKLLESTGITLDDYRYNRLLHFGSDKKKILDKFQIGSGPTIVLNPYGRNHARTIKATEKIVFDIKTWLPEYQVLLVGISGDHREIRGCIDLVNRTTLVEAGIIIENSHLFVSVDGGLMHIGIAQNVPLIGIFSSVHSRYRKPLNRNYPFFKAIDLGRRSYYHEIFSDLNITTKKFRHLSTKFLVNEIVTFCKHERK